MILEFLQKTIHHWKVLFKDKAFIVSFFAGWIVLVGGYILNYMASIYHDAVPYPTVGDLILKHVPVYDFGFLYVYGFVFIIVCLFVYSFFLEPEIAPFGLKTFGLLMVVRACFLILTYVGPPSDFALDVVSLEYAGKFGDKFFFANDLFFSGHTAIPFLGFLIFKKNKLRYFFLFGSLLMAATVLLMHVHYSIDVFAAFFITYGIYNLSGKMFKSLNDRFKTRIELYGWEAVKKLKEKVWKP